MSGGPFRVRFPDGGWLLHCHFNNLGVPVPELKCRTEAEAPVFAAVWRPHWDLYDGAVELVDAAMPTQEAREFDDAQET